MIINLLDPNPPTIDEIFGARFNRHLTQKAAGELVGYSERGWQDAEAGRRTMPPSIFALFCLATGQHDTYKLVKK